MKIQSNRQSYIDWLRAGAMFLLVFYHSGRLFDAPGWHIKNAELSMVINIFNRFLDVWHMPLFFFLAGMSVWFALEKRSIKEFTIERILRLFVPLVFSMLIIVPPQVYTERIFRGQFTGTFLEWWPHTFQGIYPEGNLSWHHLWFLAYLFTFSLFLIPLFWYFRREGGKRIVARAADFLHKPGTVLLPVVPLIIINLTLRPIYGYGNQNLVADWANFFYYITVLFYGYILVSNDKLIGMFERHGRSALITAIAITVPLGIVTSGVINAPQLDWLGKLIALVFQPVCCWFWLISIVGLGKKYLNFSNRALEYASQANMPVYILHQTVIVLTGFFIIQLAIPVWLKYIAVITGTFIISIAGYEFIKRVNVLRFPFGLKLRRKTAQPRLAPAMTQSE